MFLKLHIKIDFIKYVHLGPVFLKKIFHKENYMSMF